MSLFDSVKNKAASLTLRAFLNQHVSRYAELNDVVVDLKERFVVVKLKPKGEADVWHASVQYQVKGPKLRVLSVEANRPWLSLLGYDHLVGKEFDIPPAVAKFL